MPSYSSPRSDAERINFLRQTVAAATEHAAEGKHYITEETLTAVQAFLPDWVAAVDAVSRLRGVRAREVAQHAAAVRQLEICTRHLWAGLRNRVRRSNEPPGVLAYYRLAQDGTGSYPTTQQGWLTLAAQVIQGDAAAVEAGYPPMVNPSAEELSAALALARRKSAGLSAAKEALTFAHKAVAALRARADELIAQVTAELRCSLHQDPPSRQREVMRLYGARFIPLPGEPSGGNGNGEGGEVGAEGRGAAGALGVVPQEALST